MSSKKDCNATAKSLRIPKSITDFKKFFVRSSESETLTQNPTLDFAFLRNSFLVVFRQKSKVAITNSDACVDYSFSLSKMCQYEIVSIQCRS